MSALIEETVEAQLAVEGAGDAADNQIFIFTGNKGGVGKSTAAVLLADYLVRHGRGDDLIVGDSELSDLQRTFYKIVSQAGLVPKGRAKVWSMATDEGFEAFLDDVNAMRGQNVLVDTGANMLELLTNQIGFLAENLNDIHSEATVVFICGPGSESTLALIEYLKALTTIGKPFRTHVILMAPEEITQDAYDLERNKDAKAMKELMNALGIQVHFLGKIPERFFAEIMRGDCLPPSKLLDKWAGKMAAKRFAAWLRDELDPILGKIAGAA